MTGIPPNGSGIISGTFKLTVTEEKSNTRDVDLAIVETLKEFKAPGTIVVVQSSYTATNVQDDHDEDNAGNTGGE